MAIITVVMDTMSLSVITSGEHEEVLELTTSRGPDHRTIDGITRYSDLLIVEITMSMSMLSIEVMIHIHCSHATIVDNTHHGDESMPIISNSMSHIISISET